MCSLSILSLTCIRPCVLHYDWHVHCWTQGRDSGQSHQLLWNSALKCSWWHYPEVDSEHTDFPRCPETLVHWQFKTSFTHFEKNDLNSTISEVVKGDNVPFFNVHFILPQEYDLNDHIIHTLDCSCLDLELFFALKLCKQILHLLLGTK